MLDSSRLVGTQPRPRLACHEPPRLSCHQFFLGQTTKHCDATHLIGMENCFDFICCRSKASEATDNSCHGDRCKKSKEEKREANRCRHLAQVWEA